MGASLIGHLCGDERFFRAVPVSHDLEPDPMLSMLTRMWTVRFKGDSIRMLRMLMEHSWHSLSPDIPAGTGTGVVGVGRKLARRQLLGPADVYGADPGRFRCLYLLEPDGIKHFLARGCCWTYRGTSPLSLAVPHLQSNMAPVG